jgi:hypothetical protein
MATQILTTGSTQCDIVWHNDDWGQVWKQYLAPTDDVAGIAEFPREPLDAFWDDGHKLTVVPMVHTVGTFFYRADLVQIRPSGAISMTRTSRSWPARWGWRNSPTAAAGTPRSHGTTFGAGRCPRRYRRRVNCRPSGESSRAEP